MRVKNVRIKNVKEKMITAACTATLLAAAFGAVSVSANTSSVDDPNLNCLIYGAYGSYMSDGTSISGDANVYSQPTYGTVEVEGKQWLTLDKKTTIGTYTSVAQKVLPIYKSTSQNKTVSYYLGKTGGETKTMYFSVNSYTSSDPVSKFYLKGFLGQLRN